MNVISILTTLDRRYLPQLHVLLTSIRLNNPGESFHLYLIHSDIPEAALGDLARWCGKQCYGFDEVRVGE